jgi:chromosome partitioning protein
MAAKEFQQTLWPDGSDGSQPPFAGCGQEVITIAVANHKGGVGKTFTAIRLAVELASRGRRLLVVDADSQAHATIYFLGEEGVQSLDGNLSDLLDGVQVRKLIVSTHYPGLDLLPASLRVAEMELRLAADPGRRDQRLARVLHGLAEEYELAVIDCPPALGLVTINSLAAADLLVAPVTLTNFALNGLSRFLSWLEAFRAEGMVRARLLGILPTSYDRRQQVDRHGLRLLHDAGLPVLQPVPKRTAVERLVAAQELGVGRSEPAEVTEAYRALADSVLQSAPTGILGRPPNEQ